MLKKIKIGLLVLAMLANLLLCVACAGEEASGGDTSAPASATEDTSAQTPDVAPVEKLIIASNKNFNYNIIYPKQTQDFAKEEVDNFLLYLKDITKLSPTCRNDNGEYDAEQLEIYIGNTRHKESADALSQIGYGEYIVARIGNKIVVNAYDKSALHEGINVLFKALRENSTAEELILPGDLNIKKDLSPMITSVPKLEGAVPVSYTVRDDQAYVLAFEKAASDSISVYSALLESKGYVKFAENTMAENSFATYTNDELIVNLAYFKEERSFHVAVDSKTDFDLPSSGVSTGKTDVKEEMYLLGVSEGTFQNGMSVFFRLADGRFVIYDGGGANGAEDAENLYKQLKASADEAGVENITVAAWIITHCHADHVACYNAFLNGNYVKDKNIDIQNIIISPTSYNYGEAASEGASAEASALVNALVKAPKANIIIAHAGQVFEFAGTRIEILYTLDAMMPYDFGTQADMYNAASIVSKVYIDGKTVLMTGDCYTDGADFLTDNYGEYLKSDCLQVPHHGASNGGTVEFYKTVAPSYLAWPSGDKLFAQTTAGTGFNSKDKNLYLLDTMGLRNKCSVAGSIGKVTKIFEKMSAS